MIKRFVLFAAASLFGLTAAGVPAHAQNGGVQVKVDYDHSAPLNKIKTYSWGRVKASDPLLEPRITAAVDHVLQGEGFSLVNHNADVVVDAVEAEKNSAEYSEFYKTLTGFDPNRGWGNGGFSDSNSTLAQVALGTLVIDIYSPKSNKLVWRALAVEPQEEKKRKIEDDIDKAVGKMFTDFPPKSAGPKAPNQVEVPVGSCGNRTTSNH